MRWVVDSSVAVKWYVQEELREEARQLLDDNVLLVAPDWIVQEIAHAAFRKWRNNEIVEEQARTMVALAPTTFAELYRATLLVTRALDMALALQHPVYDCLYLACAEIMDAPVITADRRFYQAATDGGFAERITLLRSRWRDALP